MTLHQQIITKLFQHPTPESPKNIEAVFWCFKNQIGWPGFRGLLVEYSFEVPHNILTLQKWARNGKPTKHKPRQDRALEFASESGGTFTKQDLHKLFAIEIPGDTHSHISGLLNRMLKAGSIERVSTGVYKLKSA